MQRNHSFSFLLTYILFYFYHTSFSHSFFLTPHLFQFSMYTFQYSPYRYQSNTASTILGTILNIQPKDSSGGSGETRESIVYHLADDMLDKLPNDYIPFEVKNRLQKMGRQIFKFFPTSPATNYISNSPTTIQILISLQPIILFVITNYQLMVLI